MRSNASITAASPRQGGAFVSTLPSCQGVVGAAASLPYERGAVTPLPPPPSRAQPWHPNQMRHEGGIGIATAQPVRPHRPTNITAGALWHSKTVKEEVPRAIVKARRRLLHCLGDGDSSSVRQRGRREEGVQDDKAAHHSVFAKSDEALRPGLVTGG